MYAIFKRMSAVAVVAVGMLLGAISIMTIELAPFSGAVLLVVAASLVYVGIVLGSKPRSTSSEQH